MNAIEMKDRARAKSPRKTVGQILRCTVQQEANPPAEMFCISRGKQNGDSR